MEREALLKRVKEVVQSFDPEADIILYGSRARGDWTDDSDWDLLVLLSEEPDRERRNAIIDGVYEVELETDQILHPFIRTKAFWESGLGRALPLRRNIDREGLPL
jgi:predicted nucleotidyltransferase